MKKNMMNILFLLGCFFWANFPAHAQTVNRVAAMVNHKVISTTDLQARVRMAILSAGMSDSPQLQKQLTPQILDLMIEEQLQQQMADKLGLTIEDERVNFAIHDIEQRNQMAEGQLLGMLQKENIAPRIMRDHLRAGIAWSEYIRARYGDAVQVTDQEVNRLLGELKTSREEPHILLSEIVLSTPSSFQGAKVTADKLVAQLKSGVPFPALATQFSSAASAAKGGDRGWVSVNRLDENVRRALESLPNGQVSAPIQTPEGLSIFLIRDKRGAGESLQKDTLISFQQVLFPASPKASQEDLYPVFMRAKSFTDSARSCAILKKLLQNDKGVRFQEVNKTSIRSMPGELLGLFEKLDVGKPSQPVMTEMGFVIFMVCERETLNPADPTPEEAKNQLRAEGLNNIAQRELRNLRSAAFVDIRL